MKSIDAEDARRQSVLLEVFDPEHPNTLTLDTTTLEPHETAARILEHARSVSRQDETVYRRQTGANA